MLAKSLGILVIIMLLCGTVFPQVVFAVDCAKAWQDCHKWQDRAATACGAFALFPNPITEAACIAAVLTMGVVCGYAYYHCGG